MLNAFGYLSCFKLCWHNRPGPNSARPESIGMALLLQAYIGEVLIQIWLKSMQK